MITVYHKPVLVAEVITYVNPQPNGVYLDATFGGGGHTRAILEAEPSCTVIGVDWDKKALDLNGPGIEESFPGRFKSIWGNFAQLPLLLKREGIERVDGMLADFGTSQHQIMSEAGFSFMNDTPLDMRMSAAHHQFTAYDLVNKATEKELAHIFHFYGEERYSRKIARLLVELRRQKPIKTTKQLSLIIEQIVPRKPNQKIHPATKVFQALRIAVNKELENIEAFLTHSLSLLKKDGRLVCISFHSLEDRIVKNFFRDHKGQLALLTPKVVTAGDQEKSINPSSRSAKLRAAQRVLAKDD